MRWAFLLVVLVLNLALANTAFAGKRDAEWNPPTRFDHAYAGKLTVRHMPQKQVVTACAKLFGKNNVPATLFSNQKGCSVLSEDKATCTIIVINKRYALATPQAVLRHEIGHCNGWGADHPD